MALNQVQSPLGPGKYACLVTTAQQPSATPSAVVLLQGNLPSTTGTPNGTDSTLTSGALVIGISATTLATTTAAGIDIYSSLDGGTTKRLIDSGLFPATTVSATTAQPAVPIGNYSVNNPRYLAKGETLWAATRVAGSFQIDVQLATY
jgi:hypothetical protein